MGLFLLFIRLKSSRCSVPLLSALQMFSPAFVVASYLWSSQRRCCKEETASARRPFSCSTTSLRSFAVNGPARRPRATLPDTGETGVSILTLTLNHTADWKFRSFLRFCAGIPIIRDVLSRSERRCHPAVSAKFGDGVACKRNMRSRVATAQNQTERLQPCPSLRIPQIPADSRQREPHLARHRSGGASACRVTRFPCLLIGRSRPVAVETRTD